MEYNSYQPKYSSDFKRTALDKLQGNWLNAILVCVIFTLLTQGLTLGINVHKVATFGMNSIGHSHGGNIGSILLLILG